MAKRVPGKEEFYESIGYFTRQVELTGVDLRLGTRADAASLQDYDEVVLATGVTPRTPTIEGIDHPSVLGYIDVLKDNAAVGDRVAIIGAGGIGFDIAEFIGEESHAEAPHAAYEAPEMPTVDEFARQWGIDLDLEVRGGVKGVKAEPEPLARQIWLLQRKSTAPGKGLGKTTGWIHRLSLRKRGVKMMGGVQYLKIDDAGLHILHDEQKKLLEVDNVILCAGQFPQRELQEAVEANGQSVHLIGGADVAAELDAKRAIKQGSELAASI